MKCILRYRAIADLTFGDLFGLILCTQNPISLIMSPKLDSKTRKWGTKLKLFLRIMLALELCLYLILGLCDNNDKTIIIDIEILS